MMIAQNLLTIVRLETVNHADGTTSPPNHHNPSPTSTARPLLSVSKPSWIVRTESNVWRERRKKPDPPCVVCRGSGRIHCHNCHGIEGDKFQTSYNTSQGRMAKMVQDSGGSGLSYWSRCLVTGEYRHSMGFHFVKMNSDQSEYTGRYQIQRKTITQSLVDLLQSDELDSSCEM